MLGNSHLDSETYNYASNWPQVGSEKEEYYATQEDTQFAWLWSCHCTIHKVTTNKCVLELCRFESYVDLWQKVV